LTFKLQLVAAVEKGELSYAQAQNKYGIQGSSTVLVWLRKHGTLNWTLTKPSQMSNTQLTPEQRIKELEKALYDEQLKTKLLTTIIDIAEKEYGLVMRKKSTPKPPNGFNGQV
jgi:transposase-like protein